MKNLFLLSFAIVLGFSACKNAGRDKKDMTTENETKEFSLVEIWATDTLMSTCESVIFDETRNVLYVSNINSGPGDKDENGFISKLSTDGEILDLKWITGISAPKGLGIYENILYVADLDELVVIDIEQGDIINKIPVDGASFLNDIDIDSEGVVYISDSNTGKIHKFHSGV